MQQIVLPIKDSNILKMVQETLLDSFRAGKIKKQPPIKAVALYFLICYTP